MDTTARSDDGAADRDAEGGPSAVASAAPRGPRTAAVVLAGGSGRRVGSPRNKVLLDLAGVPVLAHSLRTVACLTSVVRVVVVARAHDVEEVRALCARWCPEAEVVEGGADRADSERAGFAVLAEDVDAGRVDLIAVHDGARPLAGPGLWSTVLTTAARHGGALPGRSLGPTLTIRGTGSDASQDASQTARPPRVSEDLVGVSTPQAFAAGPLLGAYADAAAEGFLGTDTASYLERYACDIRIALVPDEPSNLKITWPGDVARAEAILAG